MLDCVFISAPIIARLLWWYNEWKKLIVRLKHHFLFYFCAVKNKYQLFWRRLWLLCKYLCSVSALRVNCLMYLSCISYFLWLCIYLDNCIYYANIMEWNVERKSLTWKFILIIINVRITIIFICDKTI